MRMVSTLQALPFLRRVGIKIEGHGDRKCHRGSSVGSRDAHEERWPGGWTVSPSGWQTRMCRTPETPWVTIRRSLADWWPLSQRRSHEQQYTAAFPMALLTWLRDTSHEMVITAAL